MKKFRVPKITFFILTIYSLCISQQRTNFSHSSESFYYLNFNVGKTNVNDKFNDEFIYNFGLSVSKLNWPHLLKLTGISNLELPLFGSEPNYKVGFISNISEFNILYDYLVKPPGIESLFLGIGSGISLIKLIQNSRLIGNEEAEKQTFIRFGIPIEIKLGFLNTPSPFNKVGFLDFTYFFNLNSIENFNGWKFGLNISLN